MRDVVAAGIAPTTPAESTKAIEATKERSESWQQDMAHSIMPPMSCPQSM